MWCVSELLGFESSGKVSLRRHLNTYWKEGVKQVAQGEHSSQGKQGQGLRDRTCLPTIAPPVRFRPYFSSVSIYSRARSVTRY